MLNHNIHLAGTLDPVQPINLEFFLEISNALSLNQEINGLKISVATGAHRAFWETLANGLSGIPTIGKLEQLALDIDISDTPQDYSAFFIQPFWKNLTVICLSGPIEDTCLQRLVDQLPAQTSLSTFSLITADLGAKETAVIVKKLPASVRAADFNWNTITESNSENFNEFCQAVKNSQLSSLSLSSIGHLECESLLQTLVQVDRRFYLKLFASLHLTCDDVLNFIQAMQLNPHLTILLDDPLSFVQDKQAIAQLKAQCDQNKTPALQRLTAFYLARQLKAGETTLEEIAQLPEPVLRLLPMQQAEKEALLAKHHEVSGATPSGSASSKNTDELTNKLNQFSFSM